MNNRHRYIRFVLLAVLFTALPMTAVANADFMFKTLDARDGLTSSQVNCIKKDSRGFMWFGTPAGLYRYDGYTFRSFQSDSQDGSSLPDSYIKSIQESLDGSLWIETAAGYCVYHPQTETFERDMHQVFMRMGIDKQPSIIYIDGQRNLWGFIPGTGVVCHNMEQQLLYEFFFHSNDAHSIPEGNVCSIGECKDGAVVVYDDGRIVCCDVKQQQRIAWSSADIAQRKLRSTKTLRAFADQKDDIWLYGQGTLFLYHKNTKEWDTTIGNQLELTGIGVDHSVNGMAGDRNGNIWIGTNRHGLIRSNVNNYEMTPTPPIRMNALMPHTKTIGIESVYVDDTDLLWVGTSKSGVVYWGHNIYKFEARIMGDITAMTQDADGEIRYGTSDSGVLGYDGQLASLKVSAMQYTSDGSLWVGSPQNGMTRIKDGVSTVYSTAKQGAEAIIDDHINALATDKVGNLWIATDGGLQVYSHRMNTFSTYSRENGKMKTNNITSLFMATNNRILIGTGEGLTIVNLSTNEMTHLTGSTTNMQKFTNNYVTQVFEDTRGLIWIGTREGINILNPFTDKINYLTTKQGLCNNNICGIVEDKNRNIWITTSNGVTRVVVQRDHGEGYLYGLYNYAVNDGLQSNEFNPGSVLIKDNGDVLLGGIYGINWVRKKTANDTETLPRVMLTQLFIGEEEVLTGHEYDGIVPLPQALNETNQIELKSSQNTLTFKFAAGNYNQSERLQFMYWMEGLDESWRNGDALTHSVTFNSLSSKTYTLHVKAISAEGAISDQERIVKIVIDDPWYLSWWMLLIYAALLVLAIYVWKRGIDQMNAMWMKKKAVIDALERQREEIKATSDDLRQPMARMTSIISNLADRENSTLEEREQLNALHSQMLLVITRVSDMQLTLEHPEEKAEQAAQKRFSMNSKGELNLPDIASSEELTAEIRHRQTDSPTSKFRIIFIDDNEEFVKFVTSRLKYVYDFHPYDDIKKAADDIEMMMPDLIVCKQEMRPMTGSEFCNQIKKNISMHKIKFVLMTNGKLTPQEMRSQSIALSADDYLEKPFNMQEAVMRFNKLLGIGPVQLDNNLIEGAETRLLEDRNSSMTTATESIDYGDFKGEAEKSGDDDEMKVVETQIRRQNMPANQATEAVAAIAEDGEQEDYMSEYSMADAMDMQLLKNIEQYVLQNMSRGQIALDEMADAMGMGRVPFFHRVRSITGKTPAELVRNLRLKHACILLKRTNINMSELATNVGFMTGENFINIFKEKFGISPLEYRLKYRK